MEVGRGRIDLPATSNEFVGKFVKFIISESIYFTTFFTPKFKRFPRQKHLFGNISICWRATGETLSSAHRQETTFLLPTMQSKPVVMNGMFAVELK